MDQYRFIEEGGPAQMGDTTEDIANQTLVKRSKRVLGEDVELGHAPKHGHSGSYHLPHSAAHPY
jgi:hypothetical protein